MFKRLKKTLDFPNRSRGFDEVSGGIRFWAYYGAIEISFFVEGDAIRKLATKMPASADEALKVFGSAREDLYDVADRVYALVPQGSYSCVISTADL